MFMQFVDHLAASVRDAAPADNHFAQSSSSMHMYSTGKLLTVVFVQQAAKASTLLKF